MILILYKMKGVVCVSPNKMGLIESIQVQTAENCYCCILENRDEALDMVCYMHYTPISHNIKPTDDEEVNYTNHGSGSLF